MSASKEPGPADGNDDETLAELASVAARFAKPDVGRVRTLREKGLSFDRDVWGRLAELGWLGLAVGEELGGAGGDERAVAVVAEYLGAGAYPEPYVAASVATTRVLVTVSDAGRDVDEVLARVIDGTDLVALAVPQDVGPRVGPDAVRAEPVDGGLRLAGQLPWVPVSQADGFLALARCEDAALLVRLARDSPGLTVHEHTLADRTTGATLALEGAAVTTAEVLASGEVAERAVADAAEAALVATAAELIGVAERALAMTLEYLVAREQFGRPIGTFQALQHRAVDMYVQLRVARAALSSALSTRSHEPASRRARAAASGAYARACLTADQICRQAVRLHGAIGFTDEYDLGYYVNRMLVLTARHGGPERHRRAYLDIIGGHPASLAKED